MIAVRGRSNNSKFAPGQGLVPASQMHMTSICVHVDVGMLQCSPLQSGKCARQLATTLGSVNFSHLKVIRKDTVNCNDEPLMTFACKDRMYPLGLGP